MPLRCGISKGLQKLAREMWHLEMNNKNISRREKTEKLLMKGLMQRKMNYAQNFSRGCQGRLHNTILECMIEDVRTRGKC